MDDVNMTKDMAPILSSKPVILLGRGGGGTRLLSEMVQSLGFFFGNDISESQDSVEWVELIYQLVRDTYPLDGQPRLDKFGRNVALLRQNALAILHKGGVLPSGDWGWKLPETTLVAEHVVSAFPHARFVQLARHPVTACCRRTHMTSRLASPIGKESLKAAYTHIKRPLELLETDQAHIWNAASWAHQADVVKAAVSGPASSRHICVRFEDICADPHTVAKRICAFLEVPVDRIAGLPTVDPDRLSAQTWDDKAAAEVWDICHVQAAQLGYSNPDQIS